MNIFKRIFRKKDSSSNIKLVKEEEQIYTFEAGEISCLGDVYKYKIKATSKKEAFKYLVEYFYGNKHNEKIESESVIRCKPQHDEIIHKNLPYWFARIINGERGKGGEYQRSLEEFCHKNGIELNQS